MNNLLTDGELKDIEERATVREIGGAPYGISGLELSMHYRDDVSRLLNEVGYLRSLLDNGVMEIALERKRQITNEGWTAEHDDHHRNGEMAAAAAVYALTPNQRFLVQASRFWPWGGMFFKPGNRMKDLRRSGALIAAEIARIKRSNALSGGDRP